MAGKAKQAGPTLFMGQVEGQAMLFTPNGQGNLFVGRPIEPERTEGAASCDTCEVGACACKSCPHEGGKPCREPKESAQQQEPQGRLFMAPELVRPSIRRRR